MAEESYPFSTTQLATELQWSRLFRKLALNGVEGTDTGSTGLVVSLSGGNALIQPGEAMVNGFFYRSDAVITKAITANGTGTARKDRIILRSSQTLNSVTVQYVTGGASAPALTQNPDDVWEEALATFTVAAGASVGSALVDERRFLGKGAAPDNPNNRRNARNELSIGGTAASPIVYIGTGTGVAQVFPPAVQTKVRPSLDSGWATYGTNYMPFTYTKSIAGLVTLYGRIKATASKTNSARVLQLPAGYRPSKLFAIPAHSDITGKGYMLEVQTDGEVRFYGDSLVSGNDLAFSGSYVAEL